MTYDAVQMMCTETTLYTNTVGQTNCEVFYGSDCQLCEAGYYLDVVESGGAVINLSCESGDCSDNVTKQGERREEFDECYISLF